MNDALLSRLPRFDARQPHLPNLPETEIRPRNEEDAALLQDDGAAATAFGGGDAIDLSDVMGADLERQAALDQVIMSIESAIGEMRRAVRGEATAAISKIASTLFPKLSDLFLAEEIARHLPALIPDLMKGVDVSAAPAMAADLERAAERLGSLPSHIAFIPVRHFKGGQVEVSWRTGGFDLDFDALLASCMASMNLEYGKDRE